MFNDEDEIDWRAVEEAGFAILGLTLHDRYRAWKSFAWELTDRWYERGWILDPRGKAKSVVLTEEGVEKARELLRKHFVKPTR